MPSKTNNALLCGRWWPYVVTSIIVERSGSSSATSLCACISNPVYLRHETTTIPWGFALTCLREFPEDARHDAGYQLEKVQRDEQPDDFKPMPSIGKGVEEIRMWDDTNTYRVV